MAESDWPDWVRAEAIRIRAELLEQHGDGSFISSERYWTPRPWIHEYSRGTREHGLTVTVNNRHVYIIPIRTEDAVVIAPDQFGDQFIAGGGKVVTG